MRFSETPFADAHFASVFSGQGWDGNPEIVRLWASAPATGIRETDMPVRRAPTLPYVYGHEDGDAYLKIEHRGVVYVRRGGARRVVVLTPIPDAVLQSSVGRRLAAVVALKGIEEVRIAAVGSLNGVSTIHLAGLEDQGVEASLA